MEPVQTLVRSAANGGKDPEVIDAAHVHFYMKGGLQTFAALCIKVCCADIAAIAIPGVC